VVVGTFKLVVVAVVGAAAVGACGSDSGPLATAEPGVVFTYPSDAQLDVPLGTRVVVAFSDKVEASAIGSATIVGPNGPLSATAAVVGDGTVIEFADAPLEPGTTYGVTIGAGLAPTAQNLPSSGPLFSFTMRAERPRAVPPVLVAINGAGPSTPEAYRPMLDTSTIRLVFSEPIDPRTVTAAPGSVELLDSAGAPVTASVYADGIHVAIDPVADLTGGATYTLRLGNLIADLGGQKLTPTTIALAPKDTRGASGPIKQVLRTRQMGDPGPATTRSGAASNVIHIDKPLIGKEASNLLPVALAAELGDPKVLAGPIAFTIRRGQRLRASGLDVKLGGTIPVGLTTGDIEIELLTDAGGRIYRNPHQPAEQRPEDARAPLYVDLSLDLAVFAVDPTGNAVLSQTVLGVQATGVASAADGALSIETVSSMDLGLLGIAKAPTNFVLELMTDASATVTADATPPTLLATFPAEGSSELPVDAGIELIFSEPVDLDRLRAGGMRLETAAGSPVPAVIESRGAAVVVRPRAPLAYSTSYRVTMTDVADVAGNRLADTASIPVSTPRLNGTSEPITVIAAHPGVPCALTGGAGGLPGHCAGGLSSDDSYQPFDLPANEAIEVAFSQPPTASSVVLGTACNAGSVRVEELDASGACVAAVPGTFIQRNRSFAFVPDQPWVPAKHYRLTVVSGSNTSCTAGELCGVISGEAGNFDPLNGTTGAGGANLVIPFTAVPAATSTYMLADVSPFTDINGSGTIDTGEARADDNRAALRITGTTGAVSAASFSGTDCVPSTAEKESCMYLLGALPVEMGELSTTCPLPDGTSAAACVPVLVSPQAMYATSVTMDATAIIGITTDTGTSVMRVREPPGKPVTGYIIDKGGRATLVTKLDLYMDAPDMSIPLSSHDLHSKPLSLVLEGPVTFLPDGRIAIAVANTEDVPVTVSINAPLGVSGSVQMLVPKNEMKLQLVSRPLRGAPL